jgi:hypothetical protein
MSEYKHAILFNYLYLVWFNIKHFSKMYFWVFGLIENVKSQTENNFGLTNKTSYRKCY